MPKMNFFDNTVAFLFKKAFFSDSQDLEVYEKELKNWKIKIKPDVKLAEKDYRALVDTWFNQTKIDTSLFSSVETNSDEFVWEDLFEICSADAFYGNHPEVREGLSFFAQPVESYHGISYFYTPWDPNLLKGLNGQYTTLSPLFNKSYLAITHSHSDHPYCFDPYLKCSYPHIWRAWKENWCKLWFTQLLWKDGSLKNQVGNNYASAISNGLLSNQETLRWGELRLNLDNRQYYNDWNYPFSKYPAPYFSSSYLKQQLKALDMHFELCYRDRYINLMALAIFDDPVDLYGRARLRYIFNNVHAAYGTDFLQFPRETYWAKTAVLDTNEMCYTISEPVLRRIFFHQDWLSLALASMDEISLLKFKSAVYENFEAEQFYMIHTTNGLTSTHAKVYLVFLFLLLTFVTVAEFVEKDDLLFEKYSKFFGDKLKTSLYHKQTGEKNTPFVREFDMVCWLFTVYVFEALFMYTTMNFDVNWKEHLYEQVKEYLFGKKKKADFKYDEWHNYIAPYEENIHGVRAGNRDFVHALVLPYEDRTLDDLIKITRDYKETAHALDKLVWDQSLFNIYAERDGVYAASSMMQYPGDVLSLYGTVMSPLVKPRSVGFPKWVLDSFDYSAIQAAYIRSEYDKEPLAFSSYASLFLKEQAFHQGTSYFGHFGVFTKHLRYWSYYNSILNYSNKSPLYESELVRLRYRFDPHYSSCTSYGAFWEDIWKSFPN